MQYHRGHSVPDCFSRWEPGDPECEACTVEGMCMDQQESQATRRGNQPVQNRTVIRPASQTGSVQQTGSALSSSQMFGAPPTREEIVPREGEHWMGRLGKNMASGALSAAGTEVAYFFKYWRFD